jgi:two-component system response regulator AtoC
VNSSATTKEPSPAPTANVRDFSRPLPRNTLFLDEAGEMSRAAPAKLPRVLTDGQVVRIGSTRPRRADVRVLLATPRNLELRVKEKEGLFREDLFYRLAVVPIHIAPWRSSRRHRWSERAFLSPGGCRAENAAPTAGPDALEKLGQYRFSGNLRELRNLIERAYILTSNREIGANDLPPAQNRAAHWRGNGGVHPSALSIPLSDSF